MRNKKFPNLCMYISACSDARLSSKSVLLAFRKSYLKSLLDRMQKSAQRLGLRSVLSALGGEVSASNSVNAASSSVGAGFASQATASGASAATATSMKTAFSNNSTGFAASFSSSRVAGEFRYFVTLKCDLSVRIRVSDNPLFPLPSKPLLITVEEEIICFSLLLRSRQHH